MNYYLAIDLKKSQDNESNKKDRYKIIDLNKITNQKTNSIKDITNFTSKFNSASSLFNYLISNNYLDNSYLDKNFVICYQKPKKNGIENNWTKCGKTITKTDEILYKNENNLLSPSLFINELLNYQINNMSFENYQSMTDEEKLKVSTLILIAKELLTNDFYKYDDLSQSAYGILNYALNIRNNNIVDNKRFYMYINSLIEHLSYKYDRFDVDKAYPLKNKKGQTIINYRHLYEFSIFYIQIKRWYNSILNSKSINFPTNITELKKARKKNDSNEVMEQLTFF